MRLPRVPLAAGTVVIGDLHLDLFDEAHAAPFAAWCAGLAAPRPRPMMEPSIACRG